MEANLSPDGTLLSFGNDDNEAELWDTATGERLFILTSYSDLAWDYDFNEDGSRLIVGGLNGEVEDTIALANEHLTRDLSDAECQQYLHLDACPAN